MKLPQGYKSAGIAAGLKRSGSLDLGLIVSDVVASAAGVVTTNRVKAAPIKYTSRLLKKGTAQAVVVNSGNANACTGTQGDLAAVTMGRSTSKILGLDPASVLVASTGVIGVPMDPEPVVAGIEKAAGSLKTSIDLFSKAIMTTDTVPKRFEVSVGPGKIVGVAKGAGMIAPEMATLLVFLMTDLKVSPDDLRAMVSSSASDSFGKISVDGDRSTNDMVLALANGAAGSASKRAIANGFAEVMSALAKKVVEDGEGATRVIEVAVSGAKTEKMAKACARAVANSVLFRCAMAGGDPNWGRILAALGACGQPIDPNRISVSIGGIEMCADGQRGTGSLQAAARSMRKRHITVDIGLGIGSASSAMLTNDLTSEYVAINSEYTT